MNEFHLRFEQARDKEFWRQLNPELHITDEAKPYAIAPLNIAPEKLEEAKTSLKSEGYFQVHELLDPALTTKLAEGVTNIHKAGWPTPFAVIYDEYWELFYSLKQLFAAILGEEYKQVPNFWCWYIDTNKNSKGWGHHRDRPSVNSVLDDGLPATLTTWIPLTKATTTNGCIYVVPSPLDPNYPPGDLERRDMHELQNIRALPAVEGDVLGWTEALLHWGSRSSNKATNPRISISFTFQRADQNPFEVPLFETNRMQTFNERLGLIAQNVCKFNSHGPTTPEILFACRRLGGLIPTISVQDGAPREVLETDKRLSSSMIWALQERYFEEQHIDLWKGSRFYSTNRMPFIETYVEIITGALTDCSALFDPNEPVYIVEIGGGSGCFAFRFLNDLFENLEDFDNLKKMNFKYILTDFSKPLVEKWLENRNLKALHEKGILDFGIFKAQSDKDIQLLTSGRKLTSSEIKNPLIVIANHVFDNIEQDAFRVSNGILQESKITVFREGTTEESERAFDEEPRLDELRIIERFIDVEGSYYDNPVLDNIIGKLRDELSVATFTFPIGALKCIENLSLLCDERLILLTADQGYVNLNTEKTNGLKELDFNRQGFCTFDLNFAAISKYFKENGGTSITENYDYGGLRVAFNSLIQNRFQNTNHYFKHYLHKKNFLDSELHIVDLIKSGLKAGDYTSPRVALFLSIVRSFNYDPKMFAIAHSELLDERFQDLEDMNDQIREELKEAIRRTINNIYIIDDNHKIFDSILRLYIQLDWFEECLRFSEEILRTYGEVGPAVDHAALSCEALKKYREGYEYFQRASRLPNSDQDWAFAGMRRMAKELVKTGDSIVRVTIARAK